MQANAVGAGTAVARLLLQCWAGPAAHAGEGKRPAIGWAAS